MIKIFNICFIFAIATSYSYAEGTGSNLRDKIADERKTMWNENVITPHKMTYILPVSYTSSRNRDVYKGAGGDNEFAEGIEDTEAKLQVSFKIPLNYASMFLEDDALFFGFTVASWWQVYASDISAPFRETNYQPEIFYYAPVKWSPFGVTVEWFAGIEHQSNGRTDIISRSWNRVYVGGVFEKNHFTALLKPWYRLEEDDEDDDNQDINDYMGNFELKLGYNMQNVNVKFMALARQSFSEGHGFLELGTTFPLYGRLRGYFQVTTGYGESLIDYDHSQNTVGLGIAVTDMF